MAAYVDRGLKKCERGQLEQHIASCSQCISLIAGVIRAVAELRAATIPNRRRLDDRNP